MGNYGEKKLASLSTGEEEEEKPLTKTMLGLKLSEITDETRESAKLSEDVKGLFINEVEEGSVALDKGIKASSRLLACIYRNCDTCVISWTKADANAGRNSKVQ